MIMLSRQMRELRNSLRVVPFINTIRKAVTSQLSCHAANGLFLNPDGNTDLLQPVEPNKS